MHSSQSDLPKIVYRGSRALECQGSCLTIANTMEKRRGGRPLALIPIELHDRVDTISMIILPKVSPEVSIAARRIHKFAWAIDCLIPKHRLSEQDISAAAATVELAARGYGKFLAKKFELGTTLKPGTEAYNRAEFRNV